MKKVLVADDRMDIRLLLSALLGSWGYQMVEAANEEEACAMLQSMPPDIVISDLDMNSPDGGLQVLREAKRLHPDVPVLMCSGDFTTPPGIEEELKRAGADRFLKKPYKPEDLKRILDSFRLPTIGDALAWFLKTAGEMPSTSHFDEWKVATVTLNRCLRAAFGDNPLELPLDTELDATSHQALVALQQVAEKWRQ